MHSRRAAFVLTIVCAALLAAACGSSDDTSGAPKSTKSAAGSDAELPTKAEWVKTVGGMCTAAEQRVAAKRKTVETAADAKAITDSLGRDAAATVRYIRSHPKPRGVPAEEYAAALDANVAWNRRYSAALASRPYAEQLRVYKQRAPINARLNHAQEAAGLPHDCGGHT